VRDVGIAKGPLIQKAAEVNSFTPGNQLLRQVRRPLFRSPALYRRRNRARRQRRIGRLL
jgi:hypothetical protein